MRLLAVMLAGLIALVLGGQAIRRSGMLAAGRPDSRALPQPSTHMRHRQNKAAQEAPAAGILAAEAAAIPSIPPRRRARRATFAATSVLVMTLMLALGSIGVVQGLWSSNLTVDGVVETGDLNGDWDKIQTHDRCGQTNTAEIATNNGITSQTNSSGFTGGYGDQDHGADNPCPPDPCPEGYTHYGSSSPCPPNPCPDTHTYSTSGGSNPCPPNPCPGTDTYSVLGGTSSGGSGLDGGHNGGNPCPPECDVAIGGIDADAQFSDQVAYIDLKNTTPGYWCEIKAWVSNTGSLPFNIIGVQGIIDSKNEEGLSFFDLNGSQSGVCGLIDVNGNATAARQVDPGKEGIVHCKVLVDKSAKVCTKTVWGFCQQWTNTPGAKPGWTYHFAIEVCLAQWNEDPSTGGADADYNACKHPSSGTHEGPDTPVLPTPGPTR